MLGSAADAVPVGGALVFVAELEGSADAWEVGLRSTIMDLVLGSDWASVRMDVSSSLKR